MPSARMTINSLPQTNVAVEPGRIDMQQQFQTVMSNKLTNLGDINQMRDSNSVSQLALDDNEMVIAGPYNYLQQTPGKRIRAEVIQAFNMWMGVPSDKLAIISEAIDMLHNASLLIDDIQDDSVLRRGIPVAHRIYGIAQTINSANFFYFQAMKKLDKLQSRDVSAHFVHEMMQLHRGQGMELHWRDSLTCPTEDEYLNMISNKTGGLFRLCIKLMQTQASMPTSPSFMLLADTIGLIFQIRDDYQNLYSDEYTESKGYCDDLSEGKFSFPIIHCVHQKPDNFDLLNILRQRPADLDIKKRAIQCMERTGSFDYTRAFIAGLIAAGSEIVNEMSNGSRETPLHKMLHSLAI